MEKRISYSQFQSVKRVAQACDPLMVKKNRVKEKIEKLQAEYNDYDTQIASLEAGIKATIGFRVEELVKKVIEPGIDANGQPKKTTKYLPTDIVSYDDEKKQFVITTPDDEEPENIIQEAKDAAADETVAEVSEEQDSTGAEAPENSSVWE